MVLCAAMLAFGHNASALSVGDSHELGFLWPGIPVGNQNNTTYVNHLIGDHSWRDRHCQWSDLSSLKQQLWFLAERCMGPKWFRDNNKPRCRWRVHILVCELQRARCRGPGTSVTCMGLLTIPGIPLVAASLNGRFLALPVSGFRTVASRPMFARCPVGALGMARQFSEALTDLRSFPTRARSDRNRSGRSGWAALRPWAHRRR